MKTRTTNDIRLPNLTNCIRYLVLRLWLCFAFAFSSDALAQTIRWQEDWESPAALDCWVADFGYWEIGVPTYGPPTNSLGWRAHQGTNCAATVLAGNYTDNRESRLISCPIPIPAAGQKPRLRLWHWWSFSYGDYGQVQISTNNGATWQGLSENYGEAGSGFNYHGSDRWTRAWLDLTPYSGRTVRLGLYFYSRDAVSGNDTGPGWYVDEMVIESGDPPDFISPDNFEDAAASDRWTADHGVWEIGVPTSGPPTNAAGQRAHSGTNCLATLLDRGYYDNTWSRVSSAAFLVPAANLNPRLRFWHWWSFHYGDLGQVQISTNNGATWQVLSENYGEASSGFNYHSSDRWTRAWLDLTPYSGRTVRVGFYFYARDAVSGDDTGPGWYVDDLVLETGSLADMITPENFEDTGASDRWIADHGVWEIGVPTSGPGAAHSGTNCLATLLDRNYYDNTWSRISSQPFVVPPSQTNPRLRFWHWWSFSSGDFGKVQVSTDDGTNWADLATYTASTPWAQPQLPLAAYAGREVRLGFYFYARDAVSGDDTAPGWYIDEVRLVHEFALLLLDSPVVRTQQAACATLGIAAASPVSTANFLLRAPVGHLNNLVLNTGGCWSGAITPQPNSEWLINLQNSCATTPMGVRSIGSICFTAVSTQSAFVPLDVTDLIVTPSQPTHPFGNRAAIIANEPLLDAWLGQNRRRMLTTYGKPDTAYEIQYATNLPCPRVINVIPYGEIQIAQETNATWNVAWTNTVPPASLFATSPVLGTFSNAPNLFLRALER